MSSDDFDFKFEHPLALTLGQEAFEQISKALGGVTLVVPKSPSGKTYEFMIKHVSVSLAEKIIAKFQGEELYIPFNKQISMLKKHAYVNKRAEQLISEGQSVTEAMRQVALEVGVSCRHVGRIMTMQRKRIFAKNKKGNQ